jgi:hypothetical protein
MRLLLIWSALFASIVLVFIGGGHASLFEDTSVVASADAATE